MSPQSSEAEPTLDETATRIEDPVHLASPALSWDETIIALDALDELAYDTADDFTCALRTNAYPAPDTVTLGPDGSAHLAWGSVSATILGDGMVAMGPDATILSSAGALCVLRGALTPMEAAA